jgi:hypothetical protein
MKLTFGIASIIDVLKFYYYLFELQIGFYIKIITWEYSESLGLWTLSIVRNSKLLENTTFGKLDLFPYSDEKREATTPLGLLERATLNHWSSFRNVVFCTCLEFRTMEKIHNPSDSEFIYHRQNSLDSTCKASLMLINDLI